MSAVGSAVRVADFLLVDFNKIAVIIIKISH